LTAFVCGSASAALVTSLPGGTILPFPTENLFGPGLQTTPLISKFVLTDGFIGLRDLTVTSPSAVPLPAALPLFVGGWIDGMACSSQEADGCRRLTQEVKLSKL
jgi:hypothetical protein